MRNEIVRQPRSWVTASIATILLVVSVVPWSGQVRVPAIAVAEKEYRVFAPRPGQVQNISFKDGQQLEVGTPVIQLQSPELEHEIQTTRYKIELAGARLRRIAGDPGDRSNRAIIENELASAERKLAGLLEEQRSLTIRAPFTGQLRDSLQDLAPGDWVDRTTPIARVIDKSSSIAYGYVHEDDIWQVEVGQQAPFIPEDPMLAKQNGQVVEIAETGSAQIEIEYLSSVFGGDIASDKDEKGKIRPRSGRYLVKIKMPEAKLDRAVRGVLLLEGKPESFAAAAWRRVLQVLVRESGI